MPGKRRRPKVRRDWTTAGARPRFLRIVALPGASSMTHIAVREFAEPNACMRGDGVTRLPRIRRRCPGHVGDVILWPHVRRGISMTIEAKLHGEGLGSIG